jgi:hypothetical protein
MTGFAILILAVVGVLACTAVVILTVQTAIEFLENEQ